MLSAPLELHPRTISSVWYPLTSSQHLLRKVAKGLNLNRKEKVFVMQFDVYLFRTMRAGGFLLRSMTSLAWVVPGLQFQAWTPSCWVGFKSNCLGNTFIMYQINNKKKSCFYECQPTRWIYVCDMLWKIFK